MPDNTEEIIPYFVRLRREVAELYVSSAIKNLAQGMIDIFVPIYLYVIGFSLANIALFYLAVYIIYFLGIPLGGKLALRCGFEHCMAYAIPFLVGFYGAIYLTEHNSYFIIAAVLLLALYKIIFWPSFHADFAYYSRDGQRGRELGGWYSIMTIVAVIAPFLGGLVLVISNFGVLFLIVAILCFVSVIPLFTTKEKFRPKEFSYLASFKRLFSKKTIKKLFGYMGFGEELIMNTFWPIFIFLVVKTYFSVGTLKSLATLVTSLIMLYVGKLVDRKGRKGIVRVSSIVHCFAWLARLFAKTVYPVFAIDFISRTTKRTIAIPLLHYTYQRRKKYGTMNSIIFFEMALVFGKALAALSVFVILFYTNNIVFAFIPAAVLTLLYMLL